MLADHSPEIGVHVDAIIPRADHFLGRLTWSDRPVHTDNKSDSASPTLPRVHQTCRPLTPVIVSTWCRVVLHVRPQYLYDMMLSVRDRETIDNAQIDRNLELTSDLKKRISSPSSHIIYHNLSPDGMPTGFGKALTSRRRSHSIVVIAGHLHVKRHDGDGCGATGSLGYDVIL